MSRLTEYQKAQKWLEGFDWDNEPESCDNLATICEALQEMDKIKDKQEQGLLIILPVAEGTEVWCIGSCGELCDNCNMECSDCKKHEIVFSTNFDRNMVEQWGKTVFASESEAEEALAKMGGK